MNGVRGSEHIISTVLMYEYRNVWFPRNDPESGSNDKYS